MSSLEFDDFRPSIVITTERVKLTMHKHTNTENNNNRRYSIYLFKTSLFCELEAEKPVV